MANKFLTEPGYTTVSRAAKLIIKATGEEDNDQVRGRYRKMILNKIKKENAFGAMRYKERMWQVREEDIFKYAKQLKKNSRPEHDLVEQYLKVHEDLSDFVIEDKSKKQKTVVETKVSDEEKTLDFTDYEGHIDKMCDMLEDDAIPVHVGTQAIRSLVYRLVKSYE